MAEQGREGIPGALPAESPVSLTRHVLPLLCAVAMALASLVGTRILTTLDEMGRDIQALKIDVAVMKLDIQYLKDQASRRVASR